MIKRYQSLFPSCGRLFLFLFLAAFLISCDKEDESGSDPSPIDNVYLVEAKRVGEITKEQLAANAGKVNPLLTPLVKHGVDLYRVTYRTKHVNNETVVASGAVVIPKTNQPLSMLSVQHGTITSNELAPSNFAPNSEVMIFGTLFSGIGYIGVFPDYLGYGETFNLGHPYEHRASLASASLDLLRATKELIRENSKTINWNDKLLLAGYSEGGYATLSLQKKIEEEAKSEFNLVASSAGAGAYNKTAFMEHILTKPTHGNKDYNRTYLWVLLTYNQVYGINKPASYFFKEPYATEISQKGLMADIAVSFHEAINPSAIEDLKSGKEEAFVKAVADNDVYDWKPVTPTRLYHGTADEHVFYFNTQTAYEAMKARGAAQVELKPLEGKTHSTAIMDYLLGTYEFFLTK